MIKIGLVGSGSIASLHLNAYKMIPEAELVAITDTNSIRLKEMKDHYKANTYESLDDMFSHEDLDMVDICTPTFMHVDHSLKALNNGLNVLCEKPSSLSLEGIHKISKASKKNNVYYMTAHVIRFWHEYSYLKKVYEEKPYGNLLQASFSRICSAPAPGHWASDSQKSGGIIFDLHIHDTDYILHLLGKPKFVDSHGIRN